jgi:hypothetical protein
MNDVIAGTTVANDEVARVLGVIRDQTGSVGLNIVSTARRCVRFYT